MCVYIFVGGRGGGKDTPTLHFAYMTSEIFDIVKFYYIHKYTCIFSSYYRALCVRVPISSKSNKVDLSFAKTYR